MPDNLYDEEATLIDTTNNFLLSTKGHRGGKSRAGGGPSGQLSREVMISKALSKLLRHEAMKEGIALDREGFANLEKVMNWNRLKSLKVTFSDIQNAVADNVKQRFTLKPNPNITPIPDPTETDPSYWLIRANQGHTIALESADLLQAITLKADNIPDIVVHGTYFAFYPLIIASGGLKKMGRNHVHCSSGLLGDSGVISGMREDAELLIYIDIQKSLGDGISWWLSDNGVVLTEGDSNGLVATKYWKKVEGRKLNVGVLWEDGVEIKELPHHVRGRKAPHGKLPKSRREEGKSKNKDMRKDIRRKDTKELDAIERQEA